MGTDFASSLIGDPSTQDRRRMYVAVAMSFALHALLLLVPHTARVAAPVPGFQVTLRPSAFELQAPPASTRQTTESAVEESGWTKQREEAAVPMPDRVEPVGGPPIAVTELPLPAVIYYRTDQLTRAPHIDQPPHLNPPELEGIYGSGRIVLQLWINEQGHVVDTVIEKTELPEVFGRTAAAAFRLARFHPGELNGMSVRAIMRVEVAYERVAEKPDVKSSKTIAATL